MERQPKNELEGKNGIRATFFKYTSFISLLIFSTVDLKVTFNPILLSESDSCQASSIVLYNKLPRCEKISSKSFKS